MMSQEVILYLLEAEPDRWFCAADILCRVDIGRPSVYGSLRKLRRSGLIDFKEVRDDFNKKHVVFFYKANVEWKED